MYAVGARSSEMPIPRPDTDVSHAGGTVTLPPVRRARRRMFRRLPHCAVPGLAPICGDTNDPDTILCGIAKRLMRKIPEPNSTVLARFSKFVRDYLAAYVPQAKPMSFEEWLDSTNYNTARKEEIRAAHDRLRGGRPTRKETSRVKSFPKTESYPELKPVRMINSRCDAFKAYSGPFFKAIERVVYELPEFIKHTPVPERPKRVMALKKAGLRYYSTDFTSFESHFTPAFLNACECALYRHCLAWCPSDAEYLCNAISGINNMSTHTGVRAHIRGRRMSGDMCTSLGNGFTNLMLAKFIAFEQGKELNGFVEGDDGLFATEATLTPELYAELGFTIKISEEQDPCTASFCGMIFASSGEIVRDPVEFLANFGWTSSFIGAGERIMNELLRAKALSSVYECPQCPIVGAVARKALEYTRGSLPRFVQDGYHNTQLVPKDERNLPPFCPSADTRELFAVKYGLPVETQLKIESMIRAGDFEVLPLLESCTVPACSVRPLIFDHSAFYVARYVEVG